MSLYLALRAIKEVNWAPPTQVRAQVIQTDRKMQQLQAVSVAAGNTQKNELRRLATEGVQRLTAQVNKLAAEALSASDLAAVQAFANTQITTLSNRIKQLSSFIDSATVKSDQALNNTISFGLA